MKDFEISLQGISTNVRSTAKGQLENKRLRLMGSIEIAKQNISIEVLISSSKEGIDAIAKELNLVEVKEKMALVLVPNKHGRLPKEPEDE